MYINQIYSKNEISIRTYNACVYNKLDTLEKLINYYNKHKTFLNLNKAGNKTNEELIRICNDYQTIITDSFDIYDTNNNINDISLEDIYNKEEVSVRTYNICRQNQLKSVEIILKYYFKHKTFANLKKAGHKTNEELLNICNKYQNKYFNDIQQIILNENNLKESINNLTETQRKLINNFIEITTRNLSTRSNNAIYKYLDKNINIDLFIEKILQSETFVHKLSKNIPSKYMPEINNYISNIHEFIIDVEKTKDDNNIRKIQNKLLIQDSYSFINVPNEILENESIFKLTNLLLDKNAFFSINNTEIINKSLNIYMNENDFSLHEIGRINGKTRERVRQIRDKFLREIDKTISIIKIFKDDLINNYGIDKSKCIINITDELTNIINAKCRTNFSKEFIAYVLSSYLSEEFILIGRHKSVLIPIMNNSQNKENWSNLYLICKTTINNFNFTMFINNVNERLIDRIEQSYSFNFKSYLSKFVEEINIETLDLVFPIAEKIINDEFGLHLDDDDNIIFNSNTLKQAHQYAYEALEHLGKPSKVNEINYKINELYPNYITDVNKVRASMKRKDGFVPVGKNSIFGLKKWENEIEDFKGGTIRSITIGYLEQFDQPKHISNISEYVLRYRPKSNEKSIYYNLKAEENHTFEFFTNQLVGLKNKKYDEKFKILKLSTEKNKKSWEHSYKELTLFISTKKRLPSSVSTSDNEIKLYRWFYLQRKKIKNDELDNKKKTLIINTLIKFKFILKIISNNKLQVNNYLVNYSLNKQNLPNIKNTAEYAFYQTISNYNKIYKKKSNLMKKLFFTAKLRSK